MTTTSPPPALQAKHLTKRYGRRTALEGCDLAVPQGSIVGLVGPNGAGKSTLLQLACGLVRPTSGRVEVFGARPGATAEHLARVGFVAQDTPLYRGLSVAEHLELGRRLNRVWDHGLVHSRIRDVGITASQKVGSLSGGQRAQLALALAAAKRPDLLILDEPAAALDPMARRTFMDHLVSFVDEIGATAVLSSHLLEDVQRTCNYLAVLVAGRLRVAGTVDELAATHRVLRGPVGTPLPDARGLTVLATDDTTTLVRTAPGDAHGALVGDPAPVAELVLAYLTAPTEQTQAAIGRGAADGEGEL